MNHAETLFGAVAEFGSRISIAAAGAGTSGGSSALTTFLIYMVVVFGLAALSGRLFRGRSFLSEYFLGSRSLGVWTLALTFAATMASGGSFTGFPSYIYTHGWVLALWIGSYMVFPICAMGILGKRLNQVARRTGAITVPDVLRDRFGSPAIAALATSLIVFFLCVNLVSQFKSGTLILQTLVSDSDFFQEGVRHVGRYTQDSGWLTSVGPAYILCLLAFGSAVIVYTAWGGFHAVVWTDVMQGIVMVIGVMIMLPLALWQAGGLSHVTEELAHQLPPNRAVLETDSRYGLPAKGTWLTAPQDRDAAASGNDDSRENPRLFRAVSAVQSGDSVRVEAVEFVDASILKKLWASNVQADVSDGWQCVRVISSDPPSYPGTAGQQGTYVTAPGHSLSSEFGFLPLSLAFSYFVIWAIGGTGHPANMVRLMAFRNTRTLRMSVVTVVLYYSMIYMPLVVIFCCARVLLPGMETESDRIMPATAVLLTERAGVGWMAGLLVAAPFAAVMSTVDSFLLMISSSLVRDLYQRNINPGVSERTVKRLSYTCTVVVGVLVMAAALNPPAYLQSLIVYCSSGLAACFLAPMVYALFWSRATARGGFCSMLAGFLSHLAMYLAGWWKHGEFSRPIDLFNLDPVIVGLICSFAAGAVVSLIDQPPDKEIVRRYFFRRKSDKA